MNEDKLKGNWKQFKGQLKETWGKITDDEIQQIDGNYDQLVGKLQEKYGTEKEKAREEINEFIGKYK